MFLFDFEKKRKKKTHTFFLGGKNGKKWKQKYPVKELFIFATFWSLATVLPTNLVGNEVKNLKASGTLVPNEFTYWIPAGTPAIVPATKSTLFGVGDAAFPDFYSKPVRFVLFFVRLLCVSFLVSA